MNKNLISVIIPIYNTEAYLKKCLDSLLGQTYENWEAILANDGSTDSSGAICDAYAEKDPRFHVIHTENEGVSVTRNRAMQASSGEYITFVDSDDWLESNGLETIVRHFVQDQVDVVVTGYMSDYPTYSTADPSANAFCGVCDQTELVRQLCLVKDSYWGILCNKSFRRSCIFPANAEPVLFDPGTAFAEDQLWLLAVYKNADSACFAPPQNISLCHSRNQRRRFSGKGPRKNSDRVSYLPENRPHFCGRIRYCACCGGRPACFSDFHLAIAKDLRRRA